MTESGPLRVVLMTAIAMTVPFTERVLASRGHRLVGLVASPGPRSRRTDDYREVAQHARAGLDVIVTNYPGRMADMIRPLRPDLIVVSSFNWKLPEDVLAVPRLGAINFHDGMLPAYRGRAASAWALRNGDPGFGVTMHRMTPEFDSGEILAQQWIPVTDDDYNFRSIAPRMIQAMGAICGEALDRIAAGEQGIPQDESKATYTTGAFEPEWREIDWSDSARDTFIKVRSWYGARDVPFGALGEIDGQRCLITATKLTYEESTLAEPGTVLERRDDGTLLIQCGDGPLEILEWSPEE